MKERPIIFSTEMVKAILEGRKTQTRRARGLDQINKDNSWIYKGCGIPKSPSKHIKDNCYAIFTDPNSQLSPIVESPYGKPGDLLWVRETFLRLDRDHIITSPFAYKANGDADTEDLRIDYIKSGRKYNWKPSIHMPKDAARIWLQVEDVRLERLQAISEEDAKAEGIKSRINAPVNAFSKLVETFFDYTIGMFPSFGKIPAKSSFQTLWKSINGPESWEQNPFVWVVKFKVLSTKGKPEGGLNA